MAFSKNGMKGCINQRTKIQCMSKKKYIYSSSLLLKDRTIIHLICSEGQLG